MEDYVDDLFTTGTENAYLRSWFRLHKIETYTMAVSLRQDSVLDLPRMADSAVSPRQSHMHRVGDRTIDAGENILIIDRCSMRVKFHAIEYAPGPGSEVAAAPLEPLNTVIKAFSSYGDVDVQQFSGIAEYFTRVTVPTSHVLWRQGDQPDGLYIIESGMLRATYAFVNQTQRFEESMVPGAVAGELSALSNSLRNATCGVEHHATLWKMSMQDLDRLRKEKPYLAALFTQLVLKGAFLYFLVCLVLAYRWWVCIAASTDYDILLSAVAFQQ